MSMKFTALMLAAVLGAAGILSLSASRSANDRSTLEASVLASPDASQPNAGAPAGDAYLGDYKTGYADGFNAGVASIAYPDNSQMASTARGYLEGFSQGYSDGQNQQASLRNQLCDKNAGEQGAAVGSAGASHQAVAARRSGESRVLGDRAYNRETRTVDRGMGSTARKALLIGGGAAAGAGLGGAIGGGKGALIGALAGGGAGTYMAMKKKPARAFNRRVTAKHVATRSLIGAGAGALIGALAGGKRGALAGAALGGGGGALFGVMSGRRLRR